MRIFVPALQILRRKAEEKSAGFAESQLSGYRFVENLTAVGNLTKIYVLSQKF